MKTLLESIQTPHKTNNYAILPSYKKDTFDSHTVDCPFIFWHEGQYYMTYVGWDSFGYQTGLASSNDLIQWQKKGMLIGRGLRGSATEYNTALTCILRDNELYSQGKLKKVKGRYVGTYHTYPQPGLERGPGRIGLCFSDDLWHWETATPVLLPEEGTDWEAGGLYKSWILEHNGVFYLFYNAKNQTHGHWTEQTGMATSADLVEWKRYDGNPVIQNGRPGALDDRFASDPCVLFHEGVWVLFYFGLCSDGHARDLAAVSTDLRHWEKIGPTLVDVGIPGSMDEIYAHKPAIIARNGVLYHFYCGVKRAESEQQGEIVYQEVRGITAAHN